MDTKVKIASAKLQEAREILARIEAPTEQSLIDEAMRAAHEAIKQLDLRRKDCLRPDGGGIPSSHIVKGNIEYDPFQRKFVIISNWEAKKKR